MSGATSHGSGYRVTPNDLTVLLVVLGGYTAIMYAISQSVVVALVAPLIVVGSILARARK